jgi:hypothetical protein
MNLTRKQIKSMLPSDVTFSLRKVSFADLARDEAVKLHIKRNGREIPSMMSAEELEQWRDVIEARKTITGNTYQGKRII